MIGTAIRFVLWWIKEALDPTAQSLCYNPPLFTDSMLELGLFWCARRLGGLWSVFCGARGLFWLAYWYDYVITYHCSPGGVICKTLNNWLPFRDHTCRIIVLYEAPSITTYPAVIIIHTSGCTLSDYRAITLCTCIILFLEIKDRTPL